MSAGGKPAWQTIFLWPSSKQSPHYTVHRHLLLRLANGRQAPEHRADTLQGNGSRTRRGTTNRFRDRCYHHRLDGKTRRLWMLRMVLIRSLKAYSEVAYRKTTDNFIAVIENAF